MFILGGNACSVSSTKELRHSFSKKTVNNKDDILMQLRAIMELREKASTSLEMLENYNNLIDVLLHTLFTIYGDRSSDTLPKSSKS